MKTEPTRTVPFHYMMIAFLLVVIASSTANVARAEASIDSKSLAKDVTIYRDAWGVAHIDGKTDEATCFGFGYVQGEDFFWQVEDTYILGLGRYSEIYGVKGRSEDLLNRAFRIVPEAKNDFAAADEKTRRVCEAFAAGLNHYLATHPEVKPRLITKFEGWHVLALNRHIFMDFQLMTKFLPRSYMAKDDPSLPKPIGGSNAWVLGPSRTKNGSTILFCNPHQPGFGYGQMYEAHLRSGEGWDFTGATFFGSPLPAMGHNEHLGWSHTVNRPDTVDFWVVCFDHPTNPNLYRFGDGYREAEVWTDKFLVKRGGKLTEESETFRRTVHGPIIAKLNDKEYVAIGIARIDDAFPTRQHLQMVRAKNLVEFKNAMRPLDLYFFNTMYADRDGNIFFLYNGAIPRRDPQFDWDKKLDGSDPRTQWKGMHTFDELPQVENPLSGWLQSCNSTPYTATDDGSPLAINYPEYLADDGNEDKLRSKVSRMILRDLKDATIDQVKELAFDTRMYWPMVEIPRYVQELPNLEKRDPSLAERVKPLLAHLTQWDFKNSIDCTQSTLVEEWYRQLYGTIYPPDGEMKEEFILNPDHRYQALVNAAAEVTKRHGDWKVKWGDVHRLQRHPDVADFLAIPFNDKQPSLPCVAVPGGLGAVYTQYYTPSINIPVVREANKHYGVLGTSYIAVFEMTKEGIDGVSLTHFGTSSNPKSPHFFDQAKLNSEKQFRPSLFKWDEIRQQAKQNYHPGDVSTNR